MTNPTPRILILDDEPIILEMCADVLTQDGYLVDTTIDGREALTLLGKNKYDIVISDMKMPTLSGAKFYEMIKERYSNMTKKVIFITGDLFNIETKEFLENTNNPYLIKPFKLTELRETIKKVLNMK